MTKVCDGNLTLTHLEADFNKNNFKTSIQETKTFPSCHMLATLSQILIIAGLSLAFSRFGFLGAALILTGIWNTIKILNGDTPFISYLLPSRKKKLSVATKRNNNVSTNLVLIFNQNPDTISKSENIITRHGLLHILINSLSVTIIFIGAHFKYGETYKLSLCIFLIHNVFALSLILTEHQKTMIFSEGSSGFTQSFYTNFLLYLNSYPTENNLLLIFLTHDTCFSQTRIISEQLLPDKSSSFIISIFKTPDDRFYIPEEEGILARYRHEESKINQAKAIFNQIENCTEKHTTPGKVIRNTYYLIRRGFPALSLYIPDTKSSAQILAKFTGEINW